MTLAGLAATAAVTVAACGSNNNATTASSGPSGKSGAAGGTANCASGTIAGQGSTFQQNMQKQWISDFGSKCSGAQVNYEGTGSGAGISQFGSGTVDFAGSDVTMKPAEQSKADTRCAGKALTVPITAGGVAIIYNVKGVSALNLSPKTLAGIFQGTIKTWNDPAIKADNPSATLPATAVKPYHRADGSGTTQVLSEFLAATAGSDWKLGTGKTLNWPGASGQAAKGSDGVTAGVKQTDGGITYAEVSFAKQNSLPTAKVKSASGGFTDLTGANVSQAIATGFTVTGTGNDVTGKLDFAKMQGYPISTVSYAIVCQKYSASAKANLIRSYFTYAVGDGQQFADQLGFAPLPSSLADKAKAAFASVS